MIATKTFLVVSILGGGSLCVAPLLFLQDVTLDIVERYGLLGLHAIVVLGIGGGMLKIGWEQVKTSRQIEAVLSSLVAKIEADAEDDDKARDAAVADVKQAVIDSRDLVLAHLRTKPR